MRDALFANQKALGAEVLPQRADGLGLDKAAFQARLDSAKYAALVGASAAEGSLAGVQGTPTFFLGYTQVIALKSIHGAQGYAAFKQAIDGLLASQNAGVAVEK